MLVWGAVPSSFGPRRRLDHRRSPSRSPSSTRRSSPHSASRRPRRPSATGSPRLGYAPRSDAGTEVVARLLGPALQPPGRLRTGWSAATPRSRPAPTPRGRRRGCWTASPPTTRGWSSRSSRGLPAHHRPAARRPRPRHAPDRDAVRVGRHHRQGGSRRATAGSTAPGLVWRVMILDPAAPKGMLKKVGGRTTYEMARTTTKRSRRLSRARMRPGDIILYGPPGRRTSMVAAIDHTGINMGGGLMIHSSSQGVTIKEWDSGWHATGVRVRQVRAAALSPRTAGGARAAGESPGRAARPRVRAGSRGDLPAVRGRAGSSQLVAAAGGCAAAVDRRADAGARRRSPRSPTRSAGIR